MIEATLSAIEIKRITGYQQPSMQLDELHRQGFYRSRRSPTSGQVILERAHYQAVCEGARPANEPRVRVPVLRTRAA